MDIFQNQCHQHSPLMVFSLLNYDTDSLCGVNSRTHQQSPGYSSIVPDISPNHIRNSSHPLTPKPFNKSPEKNISYDHIKNVGNEVNKKHCHPQQRFLFKIQFAYQRRNVSGYKSSRCFALNTPVQLLSCCFFVGWEESYVVFFTTYIAKENNRS